MFSLDIDEGVYPSLSWKAAETDRCTWGKVLHSLWQFPLNVKKLSIVGSKSVMGQCVFRQKKVKLCWNQEIDVNILHAYDI